MDEPSFLPHEADRPGRDVRPRDEDVRALLREISTLRAENAALQRLCLEYITAKEQLAKLRSAVEEVFGKRSWILIKKAGALRVRLNREPTLSGRCWRSGMGVLKGMARTIRKVIGSLRAAARRRRARGADVAGAGEARAPAGRDLRTFEDLPWRRPADPGPVGEAPRGYFKVLLIAAGNESSDECADMIGFAGELSRCGDLDCRIVLERRGDVSDAFSRIVPTLELETLVDQGISRDRAPAIIGDLFIQWAHRRVAAIRSTAAIDFVSTCKNRDIDVITWPQVRAEFLRILRDEHNYYPSHALRVSVIVPNFNHTRYLEERLRSIFEQTVRPHEILFLDDASSDGSVEVARRLAAESPVPFHLVLNATNSGSTFRQWLKGIDLASGDLVWIAESDDACRPELLERLVPEFFDPSVSLAYCQSSMIGPEGQTYADDYIALTNDISVTHWRQPYCVPALEEVELALSQRNTIPNASAVVFRKRAEIEGRADLEWMRLAGDWLFYTTQIRGGRISFIAEALNAHRHHDRTVRHAFERAAELVEEQLHVKATVFEAYPVSANAIARSIAYTVAEYIHRKLVMRLDRPALTSRPKLEPLLGRIRSALRARSRPERDLRVLMVLSGDADGRGQEAAIRLANKLAESFHVFVCHACPWMTGSRLESALDERITLLEGTLGMTFWVGDRELRPEGTPAEAVSGHRAEVIGELIRLYRIDVIHSRGWWADRLVAEVGPDPSIPWFVDLCYPEGYREDAGRDPESHRFAGSMVSRIRGVFYSRPDDLEAFPATSGDRLGRVVRIFDGFDPGDPRPAGDRSVRRAGRIDRVAALTAEAYLAAVDGPDFRLHETPRSLQSA